MAISPQKIAGEMNDIDQQAKEEDRPDAVVTEDDKSLYDQFVDKKTKREEKKSPKSVKPKEEKVEKKEEEPETKEEDVKDEEQEQEETTEEESEEGDGGTDNDEEPKEVKQDKSKKDSNDHETVVRGLNEKIALLEKDLKDRDIEVQTLYDTAKNIKEFILKNNIPGIKVLSEQELFAEKLKPLQEKFGIDFIPDPRKVYTPGTPDFEYDQAFKRAQREAIEEDVRSGLAVQEATKQITKLAIESGKALDKSLDYLKNNYKIDIEKDEKILEAKKFCLENAQNPVVLAARIMQLTGDANWGLNNESKRRKVEDGIEANKRGEHLRAAPVSKTGQSKQKPTDKMSRYMDEDE